MSLNQFNTREEVVAILKLQRGYVTVPEVHEALKQIGKVRTRSAIRHQFYSLWDDGLIELTDNDGQPYFRRIGSRALGLNAAWIDPNDPTRNAGRECADAVQSLVGNSNNRHAGSANLPNVASSPVAPVHLHVHIHVDPQDVRVGGGELHIDLGGIDQLISSASTPGQQS